MRRMIFALMAWLGMSTATMAGVACVLPFNLQNATTADATQVMANYNALVTCLGQAATAGINNDITTLLGLTTPLAPSEGGSTSYTGGTSTGSANAQIVATTSPTGFILSTFKSIIFTAGFTNTGPTQLNIGGTGLTNVLKKSIGGPAALSGGEIQVGNVYSAIFDGTQYQLSDQNPQSLIAPCTVIDYAGAVAPSGYLLTNGALISRTTFPVLFACENATGVAATTTITSPSIQVANSALYFPGWFVGGINITCGSVITGITDGTHFNINNNAGASGATTLVIGPWPQGDCSTTFAVPNMLGRATVMADANQTILTTATCAQPATPGSLCGNQVQTLTLAQLPTGITSTIASTGVNYLQGTILNNNITLGNGGSTQNMAVVSPNTMTSQQVTGTATSSNTGGTSHPNLPPVALVYKAIKF